MGQLTEYWSKSILARSGVSIPESVVAHTRDEAAEASTALGPEVFIKAQVPAGRRAKAGGIRAAVTPAAAAAAFDIVTGVTIDGLRASSVLVEQRINAVRSLYMAIALDAASSGPVLLFGPEGGIDVEQAAPPIRLKLRIDGTVPAAALRREAYRRGIDPALTEEVINLAQRLAITYRAIDAQLIEINPLAVGDDGALVALDARVVIDDNALFRQPEMQALAMSIQPRHEGDAIRDATRLEFVRLPGHLGLISGGAGMTMAVMDLIDEAGGMAACFLDCSANPTPAGYGAALDLLLSDPEVEAILISIFGGLTRVDRVAKTLTTLIQEKRPTKPITIRLMGTNVEAADEILEAAGLQNIRSLRDAVNAAVASIPRPTETIA